MAIGLRDRALRDHAHLGASSNDDDALAEDALEGRHQVDPGDALNSLELRHKLMLVRGARDLELELGLLIPPGSAGDVLDVPAVAEDHLRHPVEHSRLVARHDEQSQDPGLRHP